MRVIEASFRTCLSTLQVRTSHTPQFIGITDRVSDVIADSRVQGGMVCVFSRHTTLATVIQENEPLLMTDLASFVERLSPRGAHYRHNDFGVARSTYMRTSALTATPAASTRCWGPRRRYLSSTVG